MKLNWLTTLIRFFTVGIFIFSFLGLQFQQAFANSYQEPQTPENPFGERGGENIGFHAVTGKINFLEGTINKPAIGSAIISSFGRGSAENIVQSFLNEYGELFGLDPETDSLEVIYKNKPDDQREIVRFQQYYHDVPILGAQLNIQLTSSGEIISINGEALPDITISTNPQINPQQAAEISADYLRKNSSDSEWSTQDSSLWIYSPEILESVPGEHHLVWKITSSSEVLQLNKVVLVDANSGSVLKAYEERQNISIEVYDRNLGDFTCSQSNCTDGDTDAQKAFSYFTDVYNFFYYLLGRNSYDDDIDGNGTGATISVETHVTGVQANWNGNKFQFGTGWTFADDVIGHEYAHAIDDYSSKLYPWYQSGAIGESFADIWGEFVDQVFVRGGETSDNNWKIGEDLVPTTIPSVIRDLQNPSVASMDQYLVTDADNGGIHTNNGIGNRAAYLLVNDSTYGIGLAKSIAIYYETQRNMLTSGSDYYDLYHVMVQACKNIVGNKYFEGLEGTQDLLPTTIISISDCEKVKNVLKLVRMDIPLTLGDYKQDAPYLDSGSNILNIIFRDDFESGFDNWQTGVLTGSQLWTTNPYVSGILFGTDAHSGENYYLGDAFLNNSDAYLTMKSFVTIPDLAYLYFHQSYVLDNTLDGGIIEYSTDGNTWNQVPDQWFDYNGYDSIMQASSLLGKKAFTGNSYGYYSSRINLSSLVDQDVIFRWRLATDEYSNPNSGLWKIDDVLIYKDGSPIFTDVPVIGKEWMQPWIETFYQKGITTGCAAGPLRYCPEREVTRAEMAIFILRALYSPDHTPNPSQTGIFTDVPVSGKEWMQPWIEEFYQEGITTGCATNPLRYCPERQVTRAELAVFILRAIYGTDYQPPAASGIFADVPVSGKEWMQPWIEEFYQEGITTGCASNPLRYCPERQVTRAEMAVFIDRAFGFYSSP